MTVKAQILAKLAEVADLLAEAECDGEQDVPEVGEKLDTLMEAVDYYVD
jgi:hypothetical protein